MPFRRLPFSRDSRLTALEAARLKAAASSSGVILITNAHISKLDLQTPLSLHSRYKKECGEVAPARASQVNATSFRDTLAHRARLLVVKAIHNIQSAIESDDLPEIVRGHYQLPPNKDTLPEIITPAEVRLWAGHIAAGETARLGSNDAAQIGEGPMTWPTVAKINAVLNDLTGAEAEQLRAKEKADDEDEQATALDAEVDAFIKDMWDTIEFNLRTHEATSLRRRAREWGVFYATRPGEVEETETPANPPAPTPPTA
jgi:hypothetical protein